MAPHARFIVGDERDDDLPAIELPAREAGVSERLSRPSTRVGSKGELGSEVDADAEAAGRTMRQEAEEERLAKTHQQKSANDSTYPPKAATPTSSPPQRRFTVPQPLAWIPPHLNWKGWRPVLRASVAAWCGLLLVLGKRSEHMLGQASFLVLIVATICPSSVPIATMLEQSFFQITFVAAAWGWSCLGLFCAHAARRKYRLSLSEFTEMAAAPYAASGMTRAEITKAVGENVFHGVYLETSSSVICALFLGVGGGFLCWLRGRMGPGPALFGIIFGIIEVSICMTTGLLFPYPYYDIGLVFFLPFICQQAIGIVASLVIVPETLCHQFCDRLSATLNPLANIVTAQSEMLKTKPRSEEWLRFSSMRADLNAAMGGVSLMGATENNLSREISYARIPGKDLTKLLALMRVLVSRTTGYISFWETVEKHLHRDYSDSKGGPIVDDLVLHLSGAKATPSADNTPHSSRPPSPSRPSISRESSFEGNPSTLHVPTEHANSAPPHQHHSQHSHHDPHHPHHDSHQHHGSHSRPHSKKRARSHRSFGKNKSHASINSLLHDVLHPHIELRPIGLGESQAYMDLEDQLHNPADEENIEDIIELLSAASSALLRECAESVRHVEETIHRLKAYDSILNALWYVNKDAHAQYVADSTAVLARLQSAYDDFRNSKRLDVIRPFAGLFDPTAPRDEDMLRNAPSHRGLFWAFSYEATLLSWSKALLEVSTEMLRIEKRRTHPRLWTPEWAKWKWESETGGLEDEKPDKITGYMPFGGVFHRKTFTAARHPDYETPSSWSHILGLKIYNASELLTRSDFLFGVKAAVLFVLISLPAYFKRTAYFYQTERGVWVLIMAGLTFTQYFGDTSFGFYIRLSGTLFGSAIGLAVWYIGAGRGTGSYYGMAAIVGAVLPLLMFFRVHFTPTPTAIFPAVTAMLVIGYSWQDANQPSLSSVGYGWDVGWRRCVCVSIGVMCAFVWSFVPPRSTQRETVRKTYARVIGETGGVLCQILSFANCKEDDSKAPTQIIKNIAALRQKIQKTTASKAMIKYEISLRGAWPANYYASLQTLQLEILDLLGMLLGVIAALDSKWTAALLHRAQLSNPSFLNKLLNVFQSVSNALAHNAPLPMLFVPLLESFLRPLEAIQAGHTYGFDVTLDETDGVPHHVNFETMCSLPYMRFSNGISQCYAIVNRLDRLMLVAKQLVGETYIVYGLLPQADGHDEEEDLIKESVRQEWSGSSARSSLDSSGRVH